MPSNMGSQLVANFANLTHEGLLGYLLIPIKPSPSILFKFLSCTETSGKFLFTDPNSTGTAVTFKASAGFGLTTDSFAAGAGLGFSF